LDRGPFGLRRPEARLLFELLAQGRVGGLLAPGAEEAVSHARSRRPETPSSGGHSQACPPIFARHAAPDDDLEVRRRAEYYASANLAQK